MSSFDGLFNKTFNSVALMDKNKNVLKVSDSIQLEDEKGTWKIVKIKGENVSLENNLQTPKGEITSMIITRGTIQLKAVKITGH
jgi:hypothetical protein